MLCRTLGISQLAWLDCWYCHSAQESAVTLFLVSTLPASGRQYMQFLMDWYLDKTFTLKKCVNQSGTEIVCSVRWIVV